MGASPALESKGHVDCLHRAGWIVKDPQTVIPNGYVLVESGIIRDIGACGRKTPAHEDFPVCDHGPGVLIPALVNAHTHLELSCFKDKIAPVKGFGPWVQKLLELREKSTKPEMTAGAGQGLSEILATGTGTICEISTMGITANITAESGICGLWCREFLGNLPPGQVSDPEKSAGPMRFSFAGHAPHTTAPELLIHLKQSTERRSLPFPIHLAESSEEIAFIGSGRGPWADFLTSRGIDFSGWKLPARSPVAYLDSLGILNERTLAVHVLQADKTDLDLLRRRGTPVCLCPQSNQRLHGSLPDIRAMLDCGLCLCLGTDSLASSPSLDLFDEMAFVAAHYDTIAPWRIFEMATVHGAAALHQSAMGRLQPGFKARMAYLPLTCSTENQLFEMLTNKDFNEPCRPLFPRLAATTGVINGD